MKKIIIFIIVFCILILLFIIIGNIFFSNAKGNLKNNVEYIDVKGFVSAKKQDDIIIVFETNELNINSLQIKNTGFKINDSLILKLENKNSNIQVIECKKIIDESLILDDSEDNIIKISQNNLVKKYNDKFSITAFSKDNEILVSYYIIPIKNDGKYIEIYSPDAFINYAYKFYDSMLNSIFKGKNEKVTLNINMPENVQLISFNMINEDNKLEVMVENEKIKLEITKSGIYYAVFKEDNDNYLELIFSIILKDS